ncbi:MAG TPA: hypothetical protein VMS32_11330 [Verrucomicrobiae bacterium]|nr:hypothetical protein [Verrucomicrobiae bacterium]
MMTPTPSPTPTPTPASNLYVANSNQVLLKFALPLTSGSTPVTQTTVPTDGEGLNGVAVNAQFIATLSTLGEVALFAQPLASASTPTVQFTLPQNAGRLMTFDGAGDLWAATGSDTFDEYKSPFTNGMSPALNTDNISSGLGIAFDASGNLYITDGGSFDVFAPPYTGSPISVTLPGINPVAYGNAIIGTQIFIADRGDSVIAVYNLPVTASSTPAITFTAHQPLGIASDSSGNLYVASNGEPGNIFVFAPPFTASSVPAVTVNNALNSPIGIAVGP